MNKVIYKEESYGIIGKCMDVHNNLGAGFLEIVYKDALELEFNRAGIPFEREKEYSLSNVLLSLNAKFRHDEVLSFLQSNPDPVPNPNPAPVDPPGKRDRSEVVVSTSRGGPAVTQQETLQYLDTEVMLGITYGALLLVQKIGWDTFDDTYNIYTNILTLEVGGSKVEFIQDDLFVR